jgi:hypothetical protein
LIRVFTVQNHQISLTLQPHLKGTNPEWIQCGEESARSSRFIDSLAQNFWRKEYIHEYIFEFWCMFYLQNFSIPEYIHDLVRNSSPPVYFCILRKEETLSLSSFGFLNVHHIFFYTLGPLSVSSVTSIWEGRGSSHWSKDL